MLSIKRFIAYRCDRFSVNAKQPELKLFQIKFGVWIYKILIATCIDQILL